MGDDEDNLMACLLARDLGAAKTAAVIRRPDYGELIEKIGIDAAVSPRQLTSNRIASLVRRSGVESAAVIEDGAATILEFRVRPESPIVNRKVSDIDFPESCLLAMVSRGERVFVPKGEDEIQTGDTVVGFALAKSVDKLERLFSK